MKKRFLFFVLLFSFFWNFYADDEVSVEINQALDNESPTEINLSLDNESPVEINQFIYEENHPLYFGNPTGAVCDLEQEWNFLMNKKGFSESYNKANFIPNWVAWHLCQSDLGEAERSNKFIEDKSLPEEWYALKKNDYQYNAYGFDRGHLCPSADRTSSTEDNQETFLMTNMIPQAPDCNRIVWKDLEDYERSLVKEGKELYIFAGGLGSGGTGIRGYFKSIIIEEGEILVPEFCWKIILILDEGEDDLSRVSEESRIISVCIPNKQGCQEGGSWELYECSVDYLEELLQMDFFDRLPDEIETFLEQ